MLSCDGKICWEGVQEHLGMKIWARDHVPCWMQVRSPGTQQDLEPLASLCSAAQPWPPCLLPHLLLSYQAILIHRSPVSALI